MAGEQYGQERLSLSIPADLRLRPTKPNLTINMDNHRIQISLSQETNIYPILETKKEKQEG